MYGERLEHTSEGVCGCLIVVIVKQLKRCIESIRGSWKGKQSKRKIKHKCSEGSEVHTLQESRWILIFGAKDQACRRASYFFFR